MKHSYPGKSKEELFITFLKDIQQYKDNIIIIGGWLPYIYKNYLWKTSRPVDIIGTQDIDLAVKEIYTFEGEPISIKLKKISYYKTEKIYVLEEIPVYFYIHSPDTEMRIDFISHEYANPKIVKKLIGEEVEIIPLGQIEIMLKDKNLIDITIDYKKDKITLKTPSPAAYLFIKTISLSDREIKENKYKLKKDLWSIFFIFDNIPKEEEQSFLKDLGNLKSDKQYYNSFIKNLNKYFKNVNSIGPNAVSELMNLPPKFINQKVFKTVNRFLNLFHLQ